MKSFASCKSGTSAALVLALLVTGAAQAASLGGRVSSATGPVQSALVSAYQTSSGRKSVTVTNSSGEYLFGNIPAGSYVVLIEKNGRRLYQGRTEVLERANRFDIRL